MTAHTALAAHMRLAALPTYRHRAEVVDDVERRQQAAERGRRTRLLRAAEGLSPRHGTLPPSIIAMGNKRGGRAPVVRHGFALGDEVEIVGGRYAGQRGRYDGSVDWSRCFVMTDGGRRSVGAKFVRAAG